MIALIVTALGFAAFFAILWVVEGIDGRREERERAEGVASLKESTRLFLEADARWRASPEYQRRKRQREAAARRAGWRPMFVSRLRSPGAPS